MKNLETLTRTFKLDWSAKTLVKIAMLSATSFILMLLDFPIAAIFPLFLKVDFSDVPVLLGGFALGPTAGVLIELFKNILKIIVRGTSTYGIGELSNFIVGSAFVVPASIVYMKEKTRKQAVISLVVGTVSMTILACLSNYFIVMPLYGKFIPLEQILQSSPLFRAGNLLSFVLISIAPFNLLKGLIISIVTLLIYKKLSPLLHR